MPTAEQYDEWIRIVEKDLDGDFNGVYGWEIAVQTLLALLQAKQIEHPVSKCCETCHYLSTDPHVVCQRCSTKGFERWKPKTVEPKPKPVPDKHVFGERTCLNCRNRGLHDICHRCGIEKKGWEEMPF